MANFNTDVNINPKYGFKVTAEPRVRNVQFGDGYEMSIQDGLNSDLEKFDFTFENVTTADANAIVNFLRARKGVESFDWQPPTRSSASKFKCNGWTRTLVQANIETITATFRQVFEP